jgi:hypothetical protein
LCAQQSPGHSRTGRAKPFFRRYFRPGAAPLACQTAGLSNPAFFSNVPFSRRLLSDLSKGTLFDKIRGIAENPSDALFFNSETPWNP